VRASVIIPARNAARLLPRALDAVAAQELDGDYELIVVDDASSDGTAAAAESAGARVVRCARPGGPGAARNAGAATASGEALAFLDADCVPAPGWLAAGVSALERAGLVQGAVEPDPQATRGPYDRTLWVTRATGLYESANLFVRGDVYSRVGGFDDGLLELTGHHFGEDVIFGWRARRAGVETAFCPTALAYHAVFPRGPGGYVHERRRLALFPHLARRVPELRDDFFYRRWFLSRRSASVTLAAVGAVALASRRAPAVALGAAAAAPYARTLASDARSAGVRVALVRAAADAVGLAALGRGSIAARTPLL
jgi:glycosyltransferase involved in cell wall biosynthesis